MPVLANARHERYAQELAKGKTGDEAYQIAGFTQSRGNASRLRTNESIKDRVAELLAQVAAETVTTIYDIARQLDEDREFARELEAPGPAITATMGKAKVLGLLNEKVELTGKDGGPVQMADIELARLMVFHLAKASK